MNARKFAFGPVALTNTLTTNILNPAITSLAGPVGFTATQPLIYLTRIRIVNKTAGAVTFTLYKGATGGNAAGTEVIGTATSVAANSSFEWFGSLELKSTDFLVGGASANTSLTIEGSGEITFA
jgi:hypothetical protein